MNKVKEIREQLYVEYEMLEMETQKLEQDLMLGRIDDFSFKVESVLKEFQKLEVCFELFKTLEPYFNEVSVLADDILQLTLKTGSYLEDIEKTNKRQEEFSKLPQRHKNVVGYYKDDMIHMRNIIRDMKAAIEKGDEEAAAEEMANFRIVKNLSKIGEYDKELALYETFEEVVKNLTQKREQLRQIEQGLE